MNLILKPCEIKKDMKSTVINTHFESNNDVKTSEFFEINLTHLETSLSVTCSGYNELEVMKECLSKLNDLVITYNFNNEIPETNITLEKEEYTKTIGDGKK